MIAAESSTERSVNSGVICGVVIAHDEEGEEADQRERHRGHRRHSRRTQRLQEIDETLHRLCPTRRARDRAPHPARFAQFMVSVRLIAG